MPTRFSSQPCALVLGHAVGPRAALLGLLKAWGCRVEESDDPSNGMRNSRDYGPRVAVRGRGVPPKGGHPVVRGLRSVFGAEVRIVGLVGPGQSLDREQALASGSDDVLDEGTDLARLGNFCRRFAPGRRRMTALVRSRRAVLNRPGRTA